MVEKPGLPSRVITFIHPLAIALTLMFALPMWLSYGAPPTMPACAAYFLLINYALKVNPIRVKASNEISDSFLLSFSRYLAISSPEEAFIKAYEHSPTKILHCVIGKIRNGSSLIEAFKSVKASSREEVVVLSIIADLLSFSREETSKRISLYVEYRQEKRKLRSEMAMKMSVLALRFRVLSAISSASLAVISFTSPLLSALSGLSGNIYSIGLQGTLRFNPFVFFGLLSISVTSTYLFSKMMNGVDSKKAAAFSGAIFVSVELFLIVAIGGRV